MEIKIDNITNALMNMILTWNRWPKMELISKWNLLDKDKQKMREKATTVRSRSFRLSTAIDECRTKTKIHRRARVARMQ